MALIKPMKACDYDESKLQFPIYALPKIDGVRALVQEGKLLGRSLKEHANLHLREVFGRPEFNGFDGEMAAAVPTHPELCRLTTSAVNTIKGESEVTWWLFDYITPETAHLGYEDRMAALMSYLEDLLTENEAGEDQYSMDLLYAISCLQIVELCPCFSLETLYEVDQAWLNTGYEGTILRAPHGKHKQGRSTTREGGYLRIKRFVIEEAEVLAIIEGQTNNNVAQTNELGNTFRTTHKENMVPNGMVGSLLCRNLKDNAEITVSSGCMTEAERIHYFQNQSGIVGKVIKYQCFPQGVKDKPRFPTFQCIRAESDIDPELRGQ